MENKNIWTLITGASSGIGYRYAEELAAQGCNLLLVSNEESMLSEPSGCWPDNTVWRFGRFVWIW